MTSNNRECSSQIQNSTNNRIYDRNIPSQMLQPYLSVRPVMTKYSIMPILDPRIPEQSIKTKLIPQGTYNSEEIFNPGTRNAPWSGFATNINIESELRNQVYALQSCSQSVYVPSTESDLYKFGFNNNNDFNKIQQPFPGLFKEEHFNSFNPNEYNIAQGIFQNSTRTQIRSLGDNQTASNCN
uniref:Uncharacterized protein n=1 Tax=viral metagenome TaxID=1070528 RepID=A0A6C0D8S5_9ZZZZ